MLDVNDYFPIETQVLHQMTVSTTNNSAPCSRDSIDEQFPTSVEFVELADFGVDSPTVMKGSACLNHVHVRFFNISMNRFTKVLCSDCFIE